MNMEVNLYALHVDQVLLARSACLRAQVFLAEHGVIFILITLLPGQQVHNLPDFLAQLRESLHHIVFVGKLVQYLLDHVSKLIKNAILQVNQILLVGLGGHLCIQIVDLIVRRVPMSLKFCPKLV